MKYCVEVYEIMGESSVRNFEYCSGWRKDYHFTVYDHKLNAVDGTRYTKSFIVVKNKYNVIVAFTRLHTFVENYKDKVFVPVTANARNKMLYICMMLNYILINNYNRFKIDHIFKITKDSLEYFLRDFAQERLPNGNFRGKQTVEKCVDAVIQFFVHLRHKYGDFVLLKKEDLYTEKDFIKKYGRSYKKRIPNFRVNGFYNNESIFRDLPTKVFTIMLNLAFRYTPDIAFAICMQAFAGLRIGEVLNVRQEISPLGTSLMMTQIDGRTVRIEIDLTKELPMRSDGVICGRIKKERRQSVYPPFLNAFMVAYDFHRKFLSVREFEKDYCPMFINKNGKALTYDNYRAKFKNLIENHLRPYLLNSDDAECRIYGQLLYENNLGTHALRHWFTTQLVLYGEDVAQVQYWRGDKSPESSFVYLQNKGDLSKKLEESNNLLAETILKYGEELYDSEW